MAQNYIARGEPIQISVTSTASTTYSMAGGFSSFSIDNVSSGGNVAQISIFPTSLSSTGNIISLPGQTKIVAPLNPPLTGGNITIIAKTISGTTTLFVTPIVSQLG